MEFRRRRAFRASKKNLPDLMARTYDKQNTTAGDGSETRDIGKTPGEKRSRQL